MTMSLGARRWPRRTVMKGASGVALGAFAAAGSASISSNVRAQSDATPTAPGAAPETTALSIPSVPASSEWNRAMPTGPVPGTKITPGFAQHMARDAYFWAWAMANIYGRRLRYTPLTSTVMAGPVPASPLNHLGMLTDYIDPSERIVACPNQDVVYGNGALALEISPVVIQVPDFGDRFWVYQIVDLRSDSFASLGKMYATTPGFYLLVGPGWDGEAPAGITKIFRSSTNTGYVVPRVFQDDTPEDKAAIQDVLTGIMMYPVADFDGTMKTTDWSATPVTESESSGAEEVKWVDPQTFFDVFPAVLADGAPLPGEESLYAQFRALLAAADADPSLKDAMTEAAVDADQALVQPLFEFRNWGLQLPHNWSTIINEAAFGVDYFTRTATAKSNIFVNAPNETKYFYQDLDVNGDRLNGAKGYTVTFAQGETPPVNGFWSLTLYNEHHFFAPNDINRYSVGTKNKDLVLGDDGSLTIYVQADPPAEDLRPNWLPAPANADFSLYIRAYWPQAPILDGSWTPPAVQPQS